MQEIFDKRLLFFIPFYIFCYEKRFREIETKESAMAQLQADYRRIRAYLEELCESGQLTEFERVTTVDMLRKVLDNIAVRHPRVKEGVGSIMGGKVLEHEAKTILRQGIEQGIERGIEQGILAALKSLMHKMNMTAEQAMDALDIPESDREKYGELLNKDA